MDDTQVRQGIKTHTVLVGTTQHGHVYTGPVYDPQTYANGVTTYLMEIPLPKGMYSSIRFTAAELSLPEEPETETVDEEPARPAATLTSYQLSTNHTHVWPKERINDRLAWIFQNCRYGFWTIHDTKGDVVAMYVAILGPRDRVEIVYVLEA